MKTTHNRNFYRNEGKNNFSANKPGQESKRFAPSATISIFIAPERAAFLFNLTDGEIYRRIERRLRPFISKPRGRDARLRGFAFINQFRRFETTRLCRLKEKTNEFYQNKINSQSYSLFNSNHLFADYFNRRCALAQKNKYSQYNGQTNALVGRWVRSEADGRDSRRVER